MTNIVKIKITDSMIWNQMQTAYELATALISHPKVIIDTMTEAPDLEACGFVDFLKWLSDQGIDLSRIEIHTGNMAENVSGAQVIRRADFMFELPIFQEFEPQIDTNKDIKYYFGCMVGRCTMPRLLISSHLYQCHRQRTFQTFHWRHDDDYHKTHLELEKLLHIYGPNSAEFDSAVCLLKAAPLIHTPVDRYPILNPSNWIQSCDWYQNFFVDIVCETWYQGHNFFLTEKFWRPVVTGTPFIIHGSQFILERLRDLGFRTFSHWWDEGYSQDPEEQMVLEIKRTIDSVASKSLTDINIMYGEMRETLDHNREVFKTLTWQDFYNLRMS